jgi:hypothetical protein
VALAVFSVATIELLRGQPWRPTQIVEVEAGHHNAADEAGLVVVELYALPVS